MAYRKFFYDSYATRNPSDFMRYNPRTELFEVDRSTMAVFVDGRCLNNGYANARASFGVFFGPQSQYNSAAVLDRNAHRQTNQYAELFAVYKALRDIKYHFNHGNHSFILKEKAVIILDSRYVFDCMTNWIRRWRKNNFTDYSGGRVINAHLIFKMDYLMDELKCSGMHVQLWWVNREFNQQAGYLAQSVLRPRH